MNSLQPPPAYNPQVATNNNRLNNAGQFTSPLAKSSQIFNNVVAAGGTFPISLSGTQYYLLIATLPILVRPSGGSFDTHVAGTGKQFLEQNSFDKVEIFNPNAVAVVFSIFIGWDDYIDKRLILANQQTPQVVYPTYPTPNAATSLAIPDISGSQFADINATLWIALYRVAMLFFNPDTGVTYLVQKTGAATASGPAIAAVYPQTSLRIDAEGDYALHVGGGNINAIVSEIYAAIPKT